MIKLLPFPGDFLSMRCRFLSFGRTIRGGLFIFLFLVFSRGFVSTASFKPPSGFFRGETQDSLLLENPDSLAMFARRLYLEGSRLKALSLYHRLTHLFPDYPEGFLCKSQLLLDLGRYQEALSTSDSALVLEENPATFYVQARIHEALQEPERASWAYSKAIRSDSVLTSAVLDYTSMLLRLDQCEEAMQVIHDALIRHPLQSDLLLRHSEVFAAAGRYPQAISDLTLLMGRDSTHLSEYLFRRGKYHYLSGALDAALGDLAGGLQGKPAACWYYMGVIRMDNALPDSAIHAFEQSLAFAVPDSGDSLYIRMASEKLYVLNREEDPPFIRIREPEINPQSSFQGGGDTLAVRISVMDRSRLKSIRVNGLSTYFTPNRRDAEIVVSVPPGEWNSLQITASDEYNNESSLEIPILWEDWLTPP